MFTLAEFLFYALNGVPIIATFWIIPWFIFVVLVMSAPMSLAILRHKTVPPSWFFPVYVVFFFGGLGVGTLLPLIQMDLMIECRTFEVEVSSELSDPRVIALNECRRRTNYYDDFDMWTISAGRAGSDATW
jgi:hypothetical protein